MKRNNARAIILALSLAGISCGGNQESSSEEERAEFSESLVIEKRDWETLSLDSSFKSADSVRTLPADLFSVDKDLQAAFQQLSNFSANSNWAMALPIQNEIADFTLTPSAILPKALRDKFPGVRVFEAVHQNDSSITASVVYSPQGMSVMISLGNGEYELINPAGSRHGRRSFLKAKLGEFGNRKFAENPPAQAAAAAPPQDVLPKPGSLAERNIFRIAVATTGEYTAYHGGVQNAFAALATCLSHVDLIYRTELGISFVLVDENDKLIFTDSVTDGYTNNDAEKLNPENQAIIDDIIGNGNYDIGHVLASSMGGQADGTICDRHTKAHGASGLEHPIGHPFAISYVAHEIGHQFGGRHIFNGSNCDSRAREPKFNVEPGSGSTIMGYAGICGADDLQTDSDPYFHITNLRQILATVKHGGCATVEKTDNHVPSVAVAAKTYFIPPRTPFVLSGSGKDSDGDELSYCWEQLDVHDSQRGIALGQDHSIAPIFRSVRPGPDTFRIFPRLEDLLKNAVTKQEILTNFNRDLNFALTVRDNNGAFAVENTKVKVVRNSGPFKLTSHNISSNVIAGSEVEITWAVGRSEIAPIHCTQVDISLSVDGGLSFPYVLAAQSPNNGSRKVIIPKDGVGDKVRIKVQASNNIFFDINDADLRITDLIARN
jgi:hypothetical protein